MSSLKSIASIVLFLFLNIVAAGALYSSSSGMDKKGSIPKNKNHESKKFVKHTISPGLIMAGYQGWFDAPDDGANRGWYHYGKGGKFEPGYCKVDMWPEMAEYEKQYTTVFKFADGTPATTFSSHDESTVRLHFKWMKDYGIDGVYLQRFVGEIKSTSGKSHFNKVMESAAKAALEYDRTISIMYDLSGMKSADVDVMIADWKDLMKQFGFDKRSRYSNYLFDGNRPVVAIWGVGFNDNRRYNLADIEKLIRFFKSKEAGNCSVLLGVPTYWREQGNDCVKDTNFLGILKMADIIHPWFVGRFNEQRYDAFKPLIGQDQKWCNDNNLKYMPVVFPGFSWYNMYPNSKNSFIARNHGNFFWKQLSGAASEGARMIYVAMFDEIDEGTAIFKTAHRVPVCEGSKFVPLDEDIPSDHFLWLTGQAGRMLKNKQQLPINKPGLNYSMSGQNEQVPIYRNPVIPGDFPDPTVIRVGKMYYAAGTTSDFAPIYPVYESADLVNWKQIGSVFAEPPAWASDSFWAPELYYSDGTFYVYYTAKRKGDRVSCIGVATTKDPRKGFTDHGIIIEWGKEAIDGFVFEDDDQKRYICWKAYGLNKDRPIEILASEISDDGFSLVGEHFSLTRFDQGWKGDGDEGQCLVKHDGYYYLFYSVGGCCDNRCSYRVMVSRSKDLRTGWEQYPEPILQGGETWKCTGHGTLVTTPDNRYFYMYHSYNATDFEYIGRQGMLDEVIWDKGTGWPRFKNGNTPSVQAEMPFPKTRQLRDSVYSDDFSTSKNMMFWQWDLTQPKPEINIQNNVFSITSANEGVVFVGINPKTGNYSFEAEPADRTADLSGICVYGNSKNLLAFAAGKTKLVLFQLKKGTREILAETTIPENARVSLKLEALHGRVYKFLYSTDHKNWMPFKIKDEYTIDGHFLPQWGVGIRTGLIVDGIKGRQGSYSSVRFNYSFN